MRQYTVLLVPLLFMGCFKSAPAAKGTTNVSHAIFDSLLHKYVSAEGLVNYQGFENEHQRFENYLTLLNTNIPSPSWSQDEQLAYWINTYNAYTIQLILKYKPDTSIKDITRGIQIPFVNSPWQIALIPLNGKCYNLDDIEHGIIRKDSTEPRIHFALVCAAMSCPRLRNEAYTGDKLQHQLTEQLTSFLKTENKNQISENALTLSPIFSWYKGDFTKGKTLIEFLQPYTSVKINLKASIDYMGYDWALNSQ